MKARTFWFTGLSGSGKSTIAQALAERLQALGTPAAILDGDVLRRGICADLGFSQEDRTENNRRAAHLARILNDHGLFVIAALISPLRHDRAAAADIVGEHAFIEIALTTPLDVCEARDVKGLYRRARSGELSAFTGISAPYETADHPHLALDTSQVDVARCVEMILACLVEPGGRQAAAASRTDNAMQT